MNEDKQYLQPYPLRKSNIEALSDDEFIEVCNRFNSLENIIDKVTFIYNLSENRLPTGELEGLVRPESRIINGNEFAFGNKSRDGKSDEKIINLIIPYYIEEILMGKKRDLLLRLSKIFNKSQQVDLLDEELNIISEKIQKEKSDQIITIDKYIALEGFSFTIGYVAEKTMRPYYTSPFGCLNHSAFIRIKNGKEEGVVYLQGPILLTANGAAHRKLELLCKELKKKIQDDDMIVELDALQGKSHIRMHLDGFFGGRGLGDDYGIHSKNETSQTAEKIEEDLPGLLPILNDQISNVLIAHIAERFSDTEKSLIDNKFISPSRKWLKNKNELVALIDYLIEKKYVKSFETDQVQRNRVVDFFQHRYSVDLTNMRKKSKSKVYSKLSKLFIFIVKPIPESS